MKNLLTRTLDLFGRNFSRRKPLDRNSVRRQLGLFGREWLAIAIRGQVLRRQLIGLDLVEINLLNQNKRKENSRSYVGQ